MLDRMNFVFFRLINTKNVSILSASFCPKNLALVRKIVPNGFARLREEAAAP